MNADDLLDLVDRHVDLIRADLTAEQFDTFLAAMRALFEAGTDGPAGRRALLLVRRALIPLPYGNPVREPAVDSLKLSGPASVLAPERARALSPRLAALVGHGEDPAAREILAAARRRLLAVPSRSAGELDPRVADDPLAAGLIRLNDPERGPRYPDFQFDPDEGGPFSVVTRINRLLLADEDPWGAADWWLGGNRWLADPPASLIGRVPDELLTAAALALVEGD
ncbi:hypothetical protein [Streptomyces hainanensis]|uniref:Uncharacterized protein n=1 Tax=Streptomyces hainanensis TaxID=402648 RepID=A0A4R4U0R6_9ACTN|nr:hypothetical protein [Streptomyces hainanensis]TDC80109.1 hypothetical protein E1283_01175 [Streptomyces hainanensis]